MTTTDDRQVLEEYAEWQEALTLGEPDTSIEAFMQHRETQTNTSRVTRALAAFDAAGMETHFARIVNPTAFERQAAGVLSSLRDILEGDRPYVEDHFLDGQIRRIYTS